MFPPHHLEVRRGLAGGGQSEGVVVAVDDGVAEGAVGGFDLHEAGGQVFDDEFVLGDAEGDVARRVGVGVALILRDVCFVIYNCEM